MKKWLLFTVLLASFPALLAQHAALPPTYITVDRGCGSAYYAGESILITYILQADPGAKVTVTIKEILADSTMRVLLPTRPAEPGRVYLLRVLAPPVYGKETLLMEYVITSDSKSSWHAAECAFTIKEGAYQTGSLNVECNTTNFDIFIDDAFVTHSEAESVSITGVTGGGHILTVKKTGCTDFATPFTLSPGGTVTVKVTLDCTVEDRDGDGVPDDKDQCTNPLCGLVDEKGCPLDDDGDGVDNCEDMCPGEKGERQDRGCAYRDSDADGVPDNVDQCDDPCTVVDERGCPEDTDGDGFPDCEDDCPQETGDKNHFGCPLRDSDNDSITDEEDRCYNPGCAAVDEMGCPEDTDGDGVPDCEDRCPDDAGSKEKEGCPKAGMHGILLFVLGILIAWKLDR